MGSAVSAVTNFAGSALGLGRGGNVSGQGYIDDTNALAAENARNQMDVMKGLQTQQTDFGKQLADRALGKTPSIAEAMMRQTQERNLKQQLAAAKSNRAVNPMLASRQIQKAAAEGNQQIAQQSAVNKLQEDAQNQMMFGNYLNQQQQGTNSALGRGQSTAESLFAAQTGKRNQDMSTMNGLAGAGMQLLSMSDENAKTDIKSALSKKSSPKQKTNYASGGIVSFEAYKPRPGHMFEDILSGASTGEQKEKEKGQANSFADMLQKLMSGGGPVAGAPMAGGPMDSMGAAGAGGAVPMMVANQGGKVPGPEVVEGDSVANDIIDAKLSAGEMVIPKTVVNAGPEKVAEFAKEQEDSQFNPKSFLDALKPYSYKYKNPNSPGAGEGRHLSVMAQDLEKAGPVGRSMVKQTPNGKMVDYSKGFGAILAAQADFNERMKQIESKFGKKKV
ncbi:MAG: tail fiber domain-containing protein [Candidatus Paceibacterota bacterium]